MIQLNITIDANGRANITATKFVNGMYVIPNEFEILGYLQIVANGIIQGTIKKT